MMSLVQKKMEASHGLTRQRRSCSLISILRTLVVLKWMKMLEQDTLAKTKVKINSWSRMRELALYGENNQRLPNQKKPTRKLKMLRDLKKLVKQVWLFKPKKLLTMDCYNKKRNYSNA